MNWAEVSIVGNGPSALKLKSDTMAGSILVLNNAVDRIPYPQSQALFSLDVNWIRKRRQTISEYKGECYFALPWPATFGHEFACGPEIHYLLWSYKDGLSDDPNFVCNGCNSGYAAINLAYLKGARCIHLYGYDMEPGYNSQARFWAPLFRNMLPQLRARRVQVLNHSLASYIDAFTKVG